VWAAAVCGTDVRPPTELRTPEAWQQHAYHATYATLWAADDRVPRIDYDAVSEADFIERYERPAVPVVIRGACAHWPAMERWTVEVRAACVGPLAPAAAPDPVLSLAQRLAATYGDRRLKVGEDDDGNSVRLKLRYFLQYAATTTDDSPLYVFDGSFGERLGTAPLLHDYDVPKYFRDDLFRLAGERRRPPYRCACACACTQAHTRRALTYLRCI
jgi:histone arginine demethylase JMJD6